jgi:hypothetical protein
MVESSSEVALAVKKREQPSTIGTEGRRRDVPQNFVGRATPDSDFSPPDSPLIRMGRFWAVLAQVIPGSPW